MPKFNVVCKTSSGDTVEDARFSSSRGELLGDLRAKGLTPVKVTKLEQEESAESEEAEEQEERVSKKVKLDKLAVGFRVLSTMLGGGLPIIDCLVDVAEQSEDQAFKETMLAVAREVRNGTPLSEAFSNYPKAFNPMICALVHAGQESGTLVRVLKDLSDHLERQLEIRRKVKEGTRYPLFILGVFVIAVSVIFFYIIPKFQSIFESFDAELPALTKAVMGFSNVVSAQAIFIIPGVIAAGAGIWFWKKTESGTRFFDTMFLKLPVVGEVVHQVAIARLAKTLSLLIDSGMSIVETLQLSEKTVGNTVIAEELASVRQEIVKGSTLSQQLEKQDHFPRLLVSMASAGEESGQLAPMLSKVAMHYERESSASIDGLVSLLEPAILVGLGATVAVVVVAVYMPIFKLAQAAG